MRSGHMDPPCSLSWGSRRFEDSEPGDQDGYGFRPPRAVFSHPSGSLRPAAPAVETASWPSLRFCAPSETSRPSPARTALSAGSESDPGLGVRAASPGLSCPTTHAERGFLDRDCGFPHRPGPGARFGYLLPDRPPRFLPTLIVPERPWASPSKAFPSLAMGAPLGAPAFLTLPGPVSPPKRRASAVTAFKALFPRRVRSVTGWPKPTGRRCLPEIFPFRAFPPSSRVLACSRGTGPLALGWGDVPTRLGLRASRYGWIGFARFRAAGSLGVSHLPTVETLHSRFGGRAHDFTLRGTSLDRQCRPRS